MCVLVVCVCVCVSVCVGVLCVWVYCVLVVCECVCWLCLSVRKASFASSSSDDIATGVDAK